MNPNFLRGLTCAASLVLTCGLSSQIQLVKDILPGSGSGTPWALAELEGTLYVLARPEGRVELWKTNGTGVGTVLVEGLPAGNTSQFTRAGSRLFFSIDVNDIPQLWVTDGTADGTKFVAEITAESVTAFGDGIVFRAHEPGTGSELWTSDGTAAGTRMIQDIYPGPTDSTPGSFALLGRRLLFAATSVDSGKELWVYDGNAVTMIDANGDNDVHSEPADLTAFAERVFFSATDTDGERQLYASDGTQPGTGLFVELFPGKDADPDAFLAAGSNMYFWTFDHVDHIGRAMWVTDGTVAGTRFAVDPLPDDVANIPNVQGVSRVSNMTPVGDRIIFGIFDRTHGVEYWVSGGTPESTSLLKDIRPGAQGSAPGVPVPIGFRHTYFIANDGTHGTELWRTDGTEMGTQMVQDLYPGADSAVPTRFVQLGHKIFFAATTLETGRELFCYDPGATGVSFGMGCSGGEFSPILEVKDPVIGEDLEFTGRQSPLSSQGVLYLGFPRPGTPFFLTPGCAIYMDPNREVAPVAGILVQDPTWTLGLPVPNDMSLVGLRLVGQTVYVLPGAGLAFELSNAVHLNVGT